jgi:hypothetical protein
MQTNLQIIVPDEAEMMEIANLAQARHLHLISNGERSVLSPIVPRGWKLQMDYRSRKAQQLLQVAA